MSRRPKPNHLHVVEGTGRKDRHSLENGPQAPRGAPEPPPGMSDAGLAAWRALAPMLDRMGVLTLADALALSRLCECYAEIEALRAALAEYDGPTYETTSVAGGRMVRSYPEVAMLADADRRFRAWLADFGLTPAARSKVRADGPLDGKASGLSEFFGS